MTKFVYFFCNPRIFVFYIIIKHVIVKILRAYNKTQLLAKYEWKKNYIFM